MCVNGSVKKPKFDLVFRPAFVAVYNAVDKSVSTVDRLTWNRVMQEEKRLFDASRASLLKENKESTVPCVYNSDKSEVRRNP